jgi:hypothetical protein
MTQDRGVGFIVGALFASLGYSPVSSFFLRSVSFFLRFGPTRVPRRRFVLPRELPLRLPPEGVGRRWLHSFERALPLL